MAFLDGRADVLAVLDTEAGADTLRTAHTCAAWLLPLAIRALDPVQGRELIKDPDALTLDRAQVDDERARLNRQVLQLHLGLRKRGPRRWVVPLEDEEKAMIAAAAKPTRRGRGKQRPKLHKTGTVNDPVALVRGYLASQLKRPGGRLPLKKDVWKFLGYAETSIYKDRAVYEAVVAEYQRFEQAERQEALRREAERRGVTVDRRRNHAGR